MKINIVSKNCRDAENEIDDFVKNNDLYTIPFDSSCIYLLASYEEDAIRIHLSNPTLAQYDSLANRVTSSLEFSLKWLWETSMESKGNNQPDLLFERSESMYEKAVFLKNIAFRYPALVMALRHAKEENVKLICNNYLIKTETPYFSDSRYEAYSYFRSHKVFSKNYDDSLLNLITNHLSSSEANFSYPLDQLLPEVYKGLISRIRNQFHLPKNWKIRSYTLENYITVVNVLYSLAFIHFHGRSYAIQKGYRDTDLRNRLLILDRSWLLDQIIVSTGLDFKTVENVIKDLTFRAPSFKNFDPCLQPVINIGGSDIVLMPSLLIFSSLERNFITLMNREDKSKTIYSTIVEQKEGVLRDQIIEDIKNPNLRYSQIKFPDKQRLPDVDLAIIDDINQVVLFCELKWFIGPATADEVIHRGEDLQKGICQLLAIRKALNDGGRTAFTELGISPTYRRYFALLSKTWIGHDRNQEPTIPIILSDHFVQKLNHLPSLESTCTWLNQRLFLPIEGTDYHVVNCAQEFGNWKLEWPAIEIYPGASLDC